MTKTFQKLIGLAAVGTALMLTGSAARAADSGGNQPPGKEGPCPTQDCSASSPSCLDSTENQKGCTSPGSIRNSQAVQWQDCLNCNGASDSKGKCLGYLFNITHYSSRLCLLQCPMLDANGHITRDAQGNVVYGPTYYKTTDLTLRSSTGQPCPASSTGGY